MGQEGYSYTSISAPSISAFLLYMHTVAWSQARDLELSAHLYILHVHAILGSGYIGTPSINAFM